MARKKYLATDKETGKRKEISYTEYKKLKKQQTQAINLQKRVQNQALKNILKEQFGLCFRGEEVVDKPARPFDPEADASLIEEFGEMAAKFLGKNGGLGIAGPQLGFPVRMTMVRDLDGKIVPKGQFFMMINPKIVDSNGKFYMKEGCFSVPSVMKKIKRKREVTVEYLDHYMRPQTIEVRKEFAAVIQHELDHLDGVTIAEK